MNIYQSLQQTIDRVKAKDLEPEQFYTELWPKIVTLTKDQIKVVLLFSEDLSVESEKSMAVHNFAVGMCSVFLGDFVKAIDYCQNAYKTFLELEYDPGTMAACCITAIAHRSMGQLDKAQQWLQLSNDYLGKLSVDNPYYYFQAITSYQAAELCREFKKYEDALKHYERGINFTFDNVELKGRLESGMGVTYMDLENVEMAKTYFQKALDSIKDSENFLLESKIYSDLSIYYRKIKDLDLALHNQLNSLRIREEHNLTSPIITSYVLLAQIYFDKGEPDNCIEFATKAIEKSTQLNTIIKLFDAHEIISRAYEAKGETEKAFDHYKKYHHFKDVVHNDEVARRIEQINLGHQLDTKEKEKEIFRLRNVELRLALDEIHDSFTYASRIQRSLLTSEKYIRTALDRLNKN